MKKQLTVSLLVVGLVDVPAQTLPSPAFEVASVKANKSGDATASIVTQSGGRLVATNMPVKDLVSYAYHVQTYQVVGEPRWLTSDRFDIVATADAGVPLVPPTAGGAPGTMQLMMRALLSDRFGLSAHNETREMPIYNLVVARTDGALGNRLQRSTTDCRSATPARGGTPQTSSQDQRPICGMRLGPGMMSAGGRSVGQLANTLAQFAQRPVADRTGLKGLFNFDLVWAYEPAIDSPRAAQVAPIDPDAPSLFTALREQLGLKLESTRGPVDVLVIDGVKHPTED